MRDRRCAYLAWAHPGPMYAGPILDNHFHLDPEGLRGEAVKQFARAGGTHLMLVHKPYRSVRATPETGHAKAFETTLSLAALAREAVPGIVVLVALGPHPAEYTTWLSAGVDPSTADAAYRAAIDLAGEHVVAGKASAIGEIGRPHWEGVAADVWAVANEQMEHAFATAAGIGCPAIIHCETGTPEVYAELARHCDKAGLPRGRAIKHYSPPVIGEGENHGLMPSVLVGKNAAEDALTQGTRFLMETDYMDDPKYPGAVLGPKTVPKRTRMLNEAGVMGDEAAWRIHSEIPAALYGVTFEVDAKG